MVRQRKGTKRQVGNFSYYSSREKEEWRMFLDEQVKNRAAKRKRELEAKKVLDMKEEQRM